MANEIEGGSPHRASGNWLDRLERFLDMLLGENRSCRSADGDEKFEPIDTRGSGGGSGSKITDENQRGPER